MTSTIHMLRRMADTTTCAHGVSLNKSCPACDQVCKDLDAAVTR